jgi:hypothetical protein
MPMLQQPNTNNTYLTKFDAEGDIIWSKEFEGDYCDGNSFYRIDHNNFLFLTSSFFGPYYELIEHNGSVDTIDAPNDKNKRTLFKIDAEGNVIWTTVIDNVFEMAKAGEDFYFTIQQSLTVNKDRIIVNTLNNTFELTHDGTLTKSFQPAYNYQGNNTYYMIRASDDENYFFSQVHNYYDPNPHFNSLYKYNLTTNQTVWENDKTYFPMHIKSNENGELFAMSDQGIFVIEKYNNIGQVLWRKEFERNMGERTALTSSCNGGVIMAKYEFDKEKLVVFKTNAMGDYE